MNKSKYLFPKDYMADPSVHVFEGKIYIYPSHDRESGIEELRDSPEFQCLHADEHEQRERDEHQRTDEQ